MACITRRGVNQWRVLIRRRGFPAQTRTFRAYQAAQTWARDIESTMDQGTFVSREEADRTTLGEALDRYGREITPGKRSATSEAYKLKTLRTQLLAGKFMSSIRGSDVAKFRDGRLLEAAASTVNRELALLSHVFTIAQREWGMESLRNPVRMVRKPPIRNQRDRRLLPGEESELLLRAAKYGEPLSTLIVLALETAMRRGELASMQWRYADLKARLIHLPITKNGHPRDVPLSTRAVEVLSRLPRRLDGLVFGMRPDSITQAFGRITGRAAQGKQSQSRGRIATLDNLHFHDLRHEATSRLFERGLSVMEVQTITGHRTLQMLARYTHLRASDLIAKLG